MIAIRGAVCAQNNIDSIYNATAELINTICASNSIVAGNMVAIIFSTTSDLDVANPATAVRTICGIDNVPLFSTQEMHVVGALPQCIRVMVLYNGCIGNVAHCYIGDASQLRPDIANIDS